MKRVLLFLLVVILLGRYIPPPRFANAQTCQLMGDVNCDNQVDLQDLSIVLANFGKNSNSTPTPQPSSPTATPPVSGSTGVWISKAEVLARPTSGAAWTELLADANAASATGADISNQDSNHDISTLAAALVCVRLNDSTMCTKARSAVVSAIDTENGGRWLAVGRNLGAYIIAADLLDLRNGNHGTQGSAVQAWLERFYTKTLAHNNTGDPITFRESAWSSGSNASAQEGFAYAALARYLGRQEGIDWSWMAFRRYAGDRTSQHTLTDNTFGETWQQNNNDRVGIQNAGALKNNCRLDGAIANDMGRGGDFTFTCTSSDPLYSPGWTQYPWVGLEGAVPAALILHRAGYPAFQVSNQAIKRSFDYLWAIRQKSGNVDWFDGTRANELIHLVNKAYGTNFLINTPVAGGARTVDFTDWTHPNSI